ncbi:hypothetical protein HOP62_17155 [Halomonas sp. MCCC 1A17488]|uniref:Uncharacterized protein n=1 Tax=Billgrantia sulfidoxydans TaxID=2733484 RepID=A0ABX7W7M1_9GAMM|nr:MULTISPECIES: hypothetical protein [Halomonas]MCE8017810.1 hypothetical protein [Halomonas sp. MCCC 1A17488]MCG3241143.1 hypothetical protein [Halomonas sp. MCCC 1A17488]QPP48997.1 hypothetical protein I4484_17610 [Halomonas sp. SS10-MC5]QTP56314.1 hypothetical protein HNO51_17465 [Halomonas sulfidoxydans]
MGVKRFAWGLGVLGVVLALFGWQQQSPGAFVGVALVALAGVLLATARHRPER